MHYQVSLGWFIFRIDVLNIQGPAKEWGYPIGGGGFGYVMTGYTYMQRVYAVKRFKFKFQLNYENVELEENLKEYQA